MTAAESQTAPDLGLDSPAFGPSLRTWPTFTRLRTRRSRRVSATPNTTA